MPDYQVYSFVTLKGVGKLNGDWQSYVLSSNRLIGVGKLTGQWTPPVVWYCSPLVGNGKLSGQWWLTSSTDCFVWTSKIGEMNFDPDIDGMVTKNAMSWSGGVYNIHQLGTSPTVIVYGEDGVTQMSRSGIAWGQKLLYDVGVKARDATINTRRGHYFIDIDGRLGHVGLDGSLTITDYSNYFSVMNECLVMSYDEAKDIVYICDENYGYALTAWGLGKCPTVISGAGNKNGILYATVNETIASFTFDPLEITTDTQDFEIRGMKTITGFEVGINTTKDMYGAVSYRWNKADSFFTTPWVKADRSGKVFITASGIEFRFMVKLGEYEVVRPDYIKIFGLAEEN